MPITQAMATSFKVQLLNGQQNFSANTFKIALYTSSATLNENTTAYSATNEVPSTGNYSAGGNTLTVSVTPTNTGNVAFISFTNTSWANATITANGALIYNNSQSNAAVCVLAFGGDKTSTNGTFAVNFPTADASNAIIRLTAS
jgi:transcription initiation factor TFIID subunit TAF12